MTTPIDQYRALLKNGDIRVDAGQERAAQALDGLYHALAKPRGLFRKKTPKGLYIHGGVGRGKSMLMDLFFDTIKDKVASRRQHFHEFMLETHDWLHLARQSAQEDDLLDKYAAHVAKKLKVICFDEFHVVDVADAMILSRLFTALFERGVVMVATSNWPPDRLYEGGLQRARFLPFIDLVKQKLDIIELDSGIDYRESTVSDAHNYFFPYSAGVQTQMDLLFSKYTNGQSTAKEELVVKGRHIVLRAGNGVARATFAQLCEQPYGAEDYLAIAHRFHTLFIDHIPKMGYDRRNELKRLMTLVDVLYDNRVRVFISAEAPPEKLYHGTDHAFEFDRTISRLTEMQSRDYARANA